MEMYSVYIIHLISDQVLPPMHLMLYALWKVSKIQKKTQYLSSKNLYESNEILIGN